MQQRYDHAILNGLQSRRIYEGTVSAATKRKRREKNKVARRRAVLNRRKK